MKGTSLSLFTRRYQKRKDSQLDIAFISTILAASMALMTADATLPQAESNTRKYGNQAETCAACLQLLWPMGYPILQDSGMIVGLAATRLRLVQYVFLAEGPRGIFVHPISQSPWLFGVKIRLAPPIFQLYKDDQFNTFQLCFAYLIRKKHVYYLLNTFWPPNWNALLHRVELIGYRNVVHNPKPFYKGTLILAATATGLAVFFSPFWILFIV